MFLMEHVEQNDDEAGVHLEDIGRALMIWATMNHGRDVSVRAAAGAFNTTEQIVCAAVKVDAWAFLVGPDDDPTQQWIDVDGE